MPLALFACCELCLRKMRLLIHDDVGLLQFKVFPIFTFYLFNVKDFTNPMVLLSIGLDGATELMIVCKVVS